MVEREEPELESYPENYPQSYPETSPSKIPEKSQKIIDAIRENPLISRKELSVKIGETEHTIQSLLRKLIKTRVLKRVGADRGGHWEIIKK